jgi:hypothetical protein
MPTSTWYSAPSMNSGVRSPLAVEAAASVQSTPAASNAKQAYASRRRLLV